jgi:hypothetical protein
MAWELKSSEELPCMKGSMQMVCALGLDVVLQAKEKFIKGNFSKMQWKVTDSLLGPMGESMRVNGLEARRTEKENTSGQMVKFTMVNSRMIAAMEKVTCTTQMVKCLLVYGEMVLKMVKESTTSQMVPSTKLLTLMARRPLKELWKTLKEILMILEKNINL